MRVSKEPVRVEVPHEDGAWFDLVKLNHTKTKAARKIANRENTEQAKEYGGELIKALNKSEDDGEKVAAFIKAHAYDESNFDTDCLLLDGVKAWSYEGEVTPESLSELDDTTAAWAKQAIIDLFKPPTEEQEKKV